MSEKEPVDLNDVPLATQEWVTQAFGMLDSVWRKMSEDLEERINTVDKVLAQLMLAYANVTALTEAAVATVLDGADEATLNKFRQRLAEAHARMKESLEHGQKDANTSKQRFYPAGSNPDDGTDPEAEPSSS